MKKSTNNTIKFSQVIDQINDSIVITDKSGIITYVNKAFSEHTHYSKEDVFCKTPSILKSGEQDALFYEQLWSTILDGNVFRGILINKKKNGDIYYENKTITPLKDDQNNIIGFVSSGKDVTQEVLRNIEICRLATTDQLTGIYNRHKFEELFIHEAERSRRYLLPLSLIIIDIDNFKSVNDRYGHITGDNVLKDLVSIVQNNIRKLEILSRWGGEEFLILSPGSDLKQIKKLAEKLRLAVCNTAILMDKKITISIGISTLKNDDTFSQLFERADKGLYYAKENGKNKVGYIL